MRIGVAKGKKKPEELTSLLLLSFLEICGHRWRPNDLLQTNLKLTKLEKIIYVRKKLFKLEKLFNPEKKNFKFEKMSLVLPHAA